VLPISCNGNCEPQLLINVDLCAVFWLFRSKAGTSYRARQSIMSKVVHVSGEGGPR
jgi:hypothetical protein